MGGFVTAQISASTNGFFANPVPFDLFSNGGPVITITKEKAAAAVKFGLAGVLPIVASIGTIWVAGTAMNYAFN